MIFIVGTGRSGTMSLSDYFDSLEGFQACHEPKPLLLDEIASFVQGKLSVEKLAAKLKETRPPDSEEHEYVESNHALTPAIPALLQAFPSCRILWVVRDGRDVVSSFMRGGGAFHLEGTSASHREWETFRLRPDWLGEVSTFEWLAISEFERTCWYWSRVNRLAGRHLATVATASTAILRLEALDKDLPAADCRMGLGLPSRTRVPVSNQSIHAKTMHWSSWDAERKSIFSRVAGDMMGRLYPGWRDKEGKWRRVAGFRGARRLMLRLQGMARAVVYGKNPGSRAIRRVARALPDRTKRKLQRVAGLYARS